MAIALRVAPWFAISAITLATCGGSNQPAATATPSAGAIIHGSGTVNVMYAGSLTQLFEKTAGPAFQSASGFTFQGEGKGSVAIANLIKGKVRTPDIFVSADPGVNATLQGQANGNFVSWWVPFARTEMVVGWSPQSRFAADFQAAKAGSRTWESVLEEAGVKLGRTDPELDPKGYRTLWLFQLDEQHTGESGEAHKILGDPGNPNQVFPEEQLVARLQAGQLDVGIFYRIEAVEAKLPFLTLPPAVNQGDPALAAQYATVTYTNKQGKTFKGSPIIYTITIPSTVKNMAGAESFAQFLLTTGGQQILTGEGLLSTVATVSGDSSTVPSPLNPFVKIGS